MENFSALPQNTWMLTPEHVDAYFKSRGSLLQVTCRAYHKSRVVYFRSRVWLTPIHVSMARGAGALWITFGRLTTNHDRRGSGRTATLPFLYGSDICGCQGVRPGGDTCSGVSAEFTGGRRLVRPLGRRWFQAHACCAIVRRGISRRWGGR